MNYMTFHLVGNVVIPSDELHHSPQLCVGFLFLILYPAASFSSSRPPCHQHTLCPHTLCPHTLCQHTLCPHTLCQHTLCPHTLCHTHSFTHTRSHTHTHTDSFCVAGVALMVPGGALGPGFGACDAAALCVAGVAQLDIHLRFTWQAWHLWYRVAPLGPDLAPVTPRHFAWQAWHNSTSTFDHLRFTWQAWHKLTSTFVSRGRRGTYGTGWRPWARIWRL